MKVRKKRNTGRARSTTSKAHCFSPRGSEAEEIVRAIGEGEVDALVVVDGDEERVVTLASFGAVSELNEVVRAIRSGEVDAFLMSEAGQERVYTLAAIENALRESESRFRELAELMPCIVFTASPAGKPDYFNSPWWSFIQGDRHDPSCYDLGCVLHPVECDRFRELWKLCVAEGMTCEIELEFTGPADAAPRWHLVRAVPVRADDGKIRRWFGICTDIDRTKRSELELDRQRTLLQELANSRSRELLASHERLRLSERMAVLGTLSAGIGHDIANLLFPILSRLHVLEQRNLPEEAASDVKALLISTDHLRHLVSGLRAFAIDPFHESSHQSTDLAKWWSDAQMLLSIIVPHKVELCSKIRDDLSPVGLSTSALTQVVFNLVHNAVQVFSPAGGRIEVWAKTGADGKTVLLGVTDNGPGMDENTKAHCLEPFFTTKSQDKATGLGLALVNQIIRQAGGRIEITSHPNHGATFTLHLPIASATHPAR